MCVKDFPLAWRWNNELPPSVLELLHPLEESESNDLSRLRPDALPVSALSYSTLGLESEVKVWLGSLGVPDGEVTLIWNRSTGLSLPWRIFCDYWDEFCYPSSDDIDFFINKNGPFLRWNHFEVFEYDAKAL